MKCEKDSRESTGVAFVLAVYATSRLFYLMVGGTDTLGGLASRARCSGTLRHWYGSPIGSKNLLKSSGSRSRRPHSTRLVLFASSEVVERGVPAQG
jgi:hypothetical protein